jgi:hypothetical protein
MLDLLDVRFNPGRSGTRFFTLQTEKCRFVFLIGEVQPHQSTYYQRARYEQGEVDGIFAKERAAPVHSITLSDAFVKQPWEALASLG